MKRLILTLLIASPMISFAETKSGYELVLDVVYAKKINKTIDRVNSIYGYINSYILRYGKLPTKADLKLSSTMYQAFDKNKVFDFNVDEEKVTFFNTVKNLPFKQLPLYKNSPSLKTLAVINDDLSLTIALDPKSITFLKEMKKYNASFNEPSDKSQTWYKPNGNGGFNIYCWDTNLKRWKLLDSIKLQDDMKKDMKTVYTFATKDELDTIKPKNGDIAYINENTNSIKKYIFDASQSKWLLVSSAISAKNYEVCSKDDIGVLRFDKEKNCMTSCQKDGTKYKWECMGGMISSKKIYNSCYAIKKENPSAKDGVYTIDPDGKGGVAPFKVYCDMTTDGGGWMVFKKDGQSFEPFVKIVAQSGEENSYCKQGFASAPCRYKYFNGTQTAQLKIDTKIPFKEFKAISKNKEKNFVGLYLANSNYIGYIKFGNYKIDSHGRNFQLKSYKVKTPVHTIELYDYNPSWSGGYNVVFSGELMIR